MSGDSSIEWTGKTGRSQPGSANPNWRGGRTVTSHGYVLVKAPWHPGSDVRGYIYEHRLVMEAKLGRPVAPGERIRHIDRDPSNNHPSNLQIWGALDRAKTTTCACGCGAIFTRIDKAGRARRYKSGHNGLRGTRAGARPARETGAGLSADDREMILEDFQGLCAYGCGNPASAWDHLIPWSLGGSFLRMGNAVPACTPCNTRKSNDPDIWSWIARGIAGHRPGAWEDLVSLAIGWGDLDADADWRAGS